MTLTKWCGCVVLVSLMQLTASEGPVWCSPGCPQQPHVPCKFIYNQECPTQSTSSDSWPAPPTDLQVQTSLTRTNDDSLALSFNISWGVPSDSSLKYLKGFQLQVREIGGRWRQCLLFDLSAARWQQYEQSKRLRYHYDCLTNMKGVRIQSRNFSVQVNSFPTPTDGALYPEVSQVFTAIPMLPGDNESSARWKPELLSVYNDSCNSDIQVTFRKAPAHFHFTEYEVFLVQNEVDVKNERSVPAAVDASTITTTITGVEPGEFHVRVTPHDTYSFSTSRCLCKKWVLDQLKCSSCIVTKSPYFTLHENHTACHVAAPPASPSPSPSTSGMVVGVITGVTLGIVSCIILAAAVVVYLRKRTVHRQGRPLVEFTDDTVDLPANNNVEPLAEGNVSARKRLLLLDVGGHKLHRYVVDCLAKYLVTKGHCDVQSAHSCVPDIRGEPVTWLSTEMNKSEKIVLVHSEGAYYEIQANLDAKHYRRSNGDVSPTTKLFLSAFHLLANCRAGDECGWLAKLIVVRFPYTDVCKHHLPVFVDERQYMLTDEMNRFLSSVHNKNVRLECETDSELETAIESMAAHVLRHPDCFVSFSEQPAMNRCDRQSIQMEQFQRNGAVVPYHSGPHISYCCDGDSAPARQPTENDMSSIDWIPPDSCSQGGSVDSYQINASIHRVNSEPVVGPGPSLQSLSLPSLGDSMTQPKVLQLSANSLEDSVRDDISV